MENQQHGMGWLPDYPDFWDYTFEINEMLENKIKEKIKEILSPIGLDKVDFTSLPSSVDLRPWCSKIEDQGQIGSCTANAGAGVVEYFENRAFGKYLDASRLFLYKASVLAVAPIPASLVSSVFSIVYGLDEAGGTKKAKLALFQAEKFSLAERSEEESGARIVHTLISRTVRFRDPQSERIEQIQAAAVSALMDKLSVIKDGRIHSELKLEIAHARQLVNRGDYIQTAKLIDWVARYDHLQGAYRSAEILLHRQLEIGHNVLGEEHPYTLTTMNNLALTLGAQGDLPDARKIHEQVLEITRRTLGEEHPNTSLSACNLVLTLLEMGENAGAIDILKKDLLWLLKRDPVSLEANQQKIREMIIQMIGQKDQTG